MNNRSANATIKGYFYQFDHSIAQLLSAANSDAHLKKFLSLLEIDVRAKTYDDQQREVEKLLVSQIINCKLEDAQTFYYPMAIHTIQKLAIQKNEANRRITKSRFLDEVNKKESVFSFWLRQKFGNEYYARSIKRKYFQSRSTKLSKAARIFILDVAGEFDVAKIAALLAKIGIKFSHVEHQRTPSQDRFCPYILLRGVTPVELIQLKGHLLNTGTKLVDGYAFLGAAFSPKDLAIQPTKENLTKLRFIPSADQVEPVISSIVGMSIEIFEFYKVAPIAGIKMASQVLYHKIKIDTVHFINEVI